MQTIEIKIPDMSCGHCVSTVERALSAIEGTQKVVVSLEDGCARVSGAALDYDRLHEAVREAGYTPEMHEE